MSFYSDEEHVGVESLMSIVHDMCSMNADHNE